LPCVILHIVERTVDSNVGMRNGALLGIGFIPNDS
jgi:hypothetical protein